MRDNFGDKIEARVGVRGNVYMTVSDSSFPGTARASALLSPSKARKLAIKLLKAADETEAESQ